MLLVTAYQSHQLDVLIGLALRLWPDADKAELHHHYAALPGQEERAVFLLLNEESCIGFIELSTRHDYVEGADDLPVAYVEGIYVAEEHRHKGCGRLLLQTAEEWARSKGFKQLASDTELHNTNSILFHKAAGFTEVERVVCFVKKLG